jgi:hypothetical protein
VIVLFILENLCLPRDLNVHVSAVLVFFMLENRCLPRDLNVHVSVVLVLFFLEHLCLHRDFKCVCTSGVSFVHSGATVFTP